MDAANLLAECVEGNLAAAAQAIEKIFLLKPTSIVDVELIKTILTDESRFSIFDFVENLIAGNQARALHILENLKQEGTEPVLILWGVTRELRLLADFAQQLKQGQPLENLFQKHRIFSQREVALRKFLKQFSVQDCWQLISKAGEIDKIIKGALPGNVWNSFQLFCLGLV
jgi:DNA polymerase III subunit delta